MRKMIKIFSRVHFDRNNQPKTLQISFNAPEKDNYGIKEGNIIISVLSKESSTGFSLSTGDAADVIDILTTIRRSLIKESIEMLKEEEK